MLQIARRRLEEINRTIEKGVTASDSLLGGQCGLVLYYYHLYEVTEENVYREKTIALLEEVIDNWHAEKTRLMGSTFGSGAAGFAWVLSFLVRKKLIGVDLGDELSELDNFLFNDALQKISIGEMDYLHGAMGILHYFTFRMGEEPIKEYADKLILAINDKALQDEKGWRLRNIVSGEESPDEINLSLSHGLCGVLLILINAHEHSNQKILIEKIVSEGIRYLLQFRRDVDFENGVCNYFSFTVFENSGRETISNRLAWCYGDLNQVLLLNRAGKLLQQENYIRLAQLIGLQTLLRKSESTTLATDSHLCHGSAGLAQFYKVLYEITGVPGYKTGYDCWIEQTLLYIEKELPAGKYIDFETNFLEGLAGVGLVLMSYVSNKELHWSKGLLL